MRRFTIYALVFGGILLAGTILLVTWCWLGGSFSPRITAAQLHSQIENDLPPGTPRDQIEQWLKQHHIKYNYIYATTSPADLTPVGICSGIDAHVCFEFLTKTIIYVEIHWDSDGKRTDTIIVERHIGL